MSTTPNDELAETIASTLVEGGMILENDSDDLLKKLKNGDASIGDWKVWAEKIVESKEHEDAKPSED